MPHRKTVDERKAQHNKENLSKYVSALSAQRKQISKWLLGSGFWGFLCRLLWPKWSRMYEELGANASVRYLGTLESGLNNLLSLQENEIAQQTDQLQKLYNYTRNLIGAYQAAESIAGYHGNAEKPLVSIRTQLEGMLGPQAQYSDITQTIPEQARQFGTDVVRVIRDVEYSALNIVTIGLASGCTPDDEQERQQMDDEKDDRRKLKLYKNKLETDSKEICPNPIDPRGRQGGSGVPLALRTSQVRQHEYQGGSAQSTAPNPMWRPPTHEVKGQDDPVARALGPGAYQKR